MQSELSYLMVLVAFTCHCAVSKLLIFSDKQRLVKFRLGLGQGSCYCKACLGLQIVVFNKALGAEAVVWLVELRRLGKVLVGLQKHFHGRKWQMVQAGGCEEEENLEGLGV